MVKNITPISGPASAPPSQPVHPFANSKSFLEIIPNGIDIEEESRLYDELVQASQFSNDQEFDRRSVASAPGSLDFQRPPSVFSKDIWLDDNTGSGSSLAFAQDVRINGWTSVGDKPERGYIGEIYRSNNFIARPELGMVFEQFMTVPFGLKRELRYTRTNDTVTLTN
ncbi:hypothetical protein C0989_004365 [Termitomyces sp. Mn162]|nr:hypothetical protein C0989_004365 [Termitomyces sp. Mn162]